MHDPVYRVRTPAGSTAYVRADDGSAAVLRRLAADGVVPAPEVLDAGDGWLLLRALPGAPLHLPVWRERPAEAARVAAEALRSLERAGVTHGDMCLPNILGDLETGRLAGIVDWRYAGQFDREIDVGSTVWSCGFNGYPEETAIAVLRGCGWPRADAAEVARLSSVWIGLTGPPDDPDPETLTLPS
jgi:aminoglycoside phosphotransferase